MGALRDSLPQTEDVLKDTSLGAWNHRLRSFRSNIELCLPLARNRQICALMIPRFHWGFQRAKYSNNNFLPPVRGQSI